MATNYEDITPGDNTLFQQAEAIWTAIRPLQSHAAGKMVSALVSADNPHGYPSVQVFPVRVAITASGQSETICEYPCHGHMLVGVLQLKKGHEIDATTSTVNMAQWTQSAIDDIFPDSNLLSNMVGANLSSLTVKNPVLMVINDLSASGEQDIVVRQIASGNHPEFVIRKSAGTGGLSLEFDLDNQYDTPAKLAAAPYLSIRGFVAVLNQTMGGYRIPLEGNGRHFSVAVTDEGSGTYSLPVAYVPGTLVVYDTDGDNLVRIQPGAITESDPASGEFESTVSLTSGFADFTAYVMDIS